MVETVVLIICVVGGLVFMKVYLQRAIQGGLLSGTSSLGLQFDPRDPYRDRQTVSASDETHLVPQVGMEGLAGAALLGTGGIGILPDLPMSPAYREPSVQQTQVTASWTTETTPDTIYCEQRLAGGCP